MLLAGLVLATAFITDSAAADPSESSPPPTTEASETTTPPSQTSSTEPSAPEAAEPVAPAQRPELEVTAEFDKPSYDASEPVAITLRIKNVGPDKAVGLRASNRSDLPTELVFDPRQWGELRFGELGVTIEPGATHEKMLSGTVKDLNVGVVTLTGQVWDHDGLGINEFSFSAPVTKSLSHVAGIVFGDRNGNGAFDDGEALAGITLTLHYRHGQTSYTATSDGAGRFDFGQIPAVSYSAGGNMTGGWLFPFRRIDIDKSNDNTNLRMRAVPPLNGALNATMDRPHWTRGPRSLFWGADAHIWAPCSQNSDLHPVDRGCWDR